MKSLESYNYYKIKSKQDLKNCLDFERKQYCEYMYKNRKDYCLGLIRSECVMQIMKWQAISRKTDYYDYVYHTKGGMLNLIKYIWYMRRKNKIGNKYGLEVCTALTGKGLLIYHLNNVVNGNSDIGENCHIHGTVVIGNAGPHSGKCPKIGDNVMIGAGAKIIGDITIGNNIKIGAGATVVNSFTEDGITIGGVPARKLK